MPTFKIEVTLEKGNLSIQATGQPKVAVYPESETKFFLKIVEAQIEFSRDANNKVEKLTLYQGGAVMPGKKVK